MFHSGFIITDWNQPRIYFLSKTPEINSAKLQMA